MNDTLGTIQALGKVSDQVRATEIYQIIANFHAKEREKHRLVQRIIRIQQSRRDLEEDLALTREYLTDFPLLKQILFEELEKNQAAFDVAISRFESLSHKIIEEGEVIRVKLKTLDL